MILPSIIPALPPKGRIKKSNQTCYQTSWKNNIDILTPIIYYVNLISQEGMAFHGIALRKPILSHRWVLFGIDLWKPILSYLWVFLGIALGKPITSHHWILFGISIRKPIPCTIGFCLGLPSGNPFPHWLKSRC